MLVLGRDAAITFMNTFHPGLGQRPIDLVAQSEDGRNGVERALQIASERL